MPVIAVVLAHRHLAVSATTPVRARPSQHPWVAAMIAHTKVSLRLPAQPLVEQTPTESSGLGPPAVHLNA